MTTELTIDERNQRSFDTFRKIIASENEDGTPRFPVADFDRPDDLVIRSSTYGDMHLYWHNKQERFITQDEAITITNDLFNDIFGLQTANDERSRLGMDLSVNVKNFPLTLVVYRLNTTEDNNEPYIVSEGYNLASILLVANTSTPHFYLERTKDNRYYNQRGSLVWLNSGSIYTKVKTRSGMVTKPARITDELDVIPFLDSPLSELPILRVARDIHRERKEHKEPNKEFPLPLMCENLADVPNRIELLKRHYKQFDQLTAFLNPNKFTTSELMTLMTLRPKLTPDAFRRVVAWVRTAEHPLEGAFGELYRTNRRSHTRCRYAIALFASYLQSRFKNDDAEIYTRLLRNLSDCEHMRKRLRIKFDIRATSFAGFTRYHDKLTERYNKANIKRTARRDPNFIKPFERDDKWIAQWQNVEDALLASDLNVSVLDSAYALKNEGITMHHCVGLYTGSVRTGHSHITHLEYEGEPYTLELVRQQTTTDADGNYTLEPGIFINQLYGRYDSIAPQELHTRIQAILDTVNKTNAKLEKQPA